MKIQSKFKDYYDSAFISHDEDDVFFARLSEIKKVRLASDTFDHLYDIHKLKFNNFRYNDLFSFGIIGFCGKIYPYIKKKKSNTYYYNLKDIEEDSTEDEYLALLASGYSVFYMRSSIHKDEKAKQLKQFFNPETHKKSAEFFSMLNVPYFDFQYKSESDKKSHGYSFFEIEVNPNLKERQFFKVVESPIAFQEISMFLGGVLVKPTKSMEQISDKVKIQQHGFDPKYGFRTVPTKKK